MYQRDRVGPWKCFVLQNPQLPDFKKILYRSVVDTIKKQLMRAVGIVLGSDFSVVFPSWYHSIYFSALGYSRHCLW